MRRLLSFLLLCGIAVAAQAETYSGKVIAVIDGDTVLVLKHGHPVKIRLANIDAPEKGQDFGLAARDELARLVLRREVEVGTVAVDKYGRSVALLRRDGRSVNEDMVRLGMAWEYSHFHRDRRYVELQQQARAAGRGLWRQGNPTPPWEWRKQHANEAALPPVLKPGDYSCGSKRRCSQMVSCNEAHYYLTVCGVRTLDPEGDGVPCKSLCRR